jgi:hypothetical protein
MTETEELAKFTGPGMPFGFLETAILTFNIDGVDYYFKKGSDDNKRMLPTTLKSEASIFDVYKKPNYDHVFKIKGENAYMNTHRERNNNWLKYTSNLRLNGQNLHEDHIFQFAKYNNGMSSGKSTFHFVADTGFELNHYQNTANFIESLVTGLRLEAVSSPEPEPTPTFEPEPEPTPTFEPEPEPTPTFEPEPEPTPTPTPTTPGAKFSIIQDYKCGPGSSVLKSGWQANLDNCNADCENNKECRYFSFDNKVCMLMNSCSRVAQTGKTIYEVPISRYTEKAVNFSSQANVDIDSSIKELNTSTSDLEDTTVTLQAATSSLQTAATSLKRQSNEGLEDSPKSVALAAEIEVLNNSIARAEELANKQSKLLKEKESIINDSSLSSNERDALLQKTISRLNSTTTQLTNLKSRINTSKDLIDVQVEEIDGSVGFINNVIEAISDIIESLFE